MKIEKQLKLKIEVVLRICMIMLTVITIYSCSNNSLTDNNLENNIGIEESRGISVGSTVSILSGTSNKYVSVGSSEYIYATSGSVGNNEKFIVVDSGSGYVAFKSKKNNSYLSVANKTDTIRANKSSITDNQKFRIDTRNDGFYGIYSKSLGVYLNISPGNNNGIKAQWNDLNGGWQQFKISPIAVNSYNLDIGVDLSEGLYAQSKGVVFKDLNGKSKDVFKIFSENGYKWVRVRVNIDPDNSDYGMFTNLEYAKKLGARAKNSGFKLLVDFHYSKWWADPGNQWTPKAWETTNINTLCTSVYSWSKNATQQLINAGAAPDMVQIGNEINDGLLWDLGKISSVGSWKNVAYLINSGINGVKDSGSSAKIMLHTATGGSWTQTNNWINNFISAGGYWNKVDAFGLSYYSMWHGSFTDLSNNLSNLNSKYSDKKIFIIETAYYWDTNESGYSGSSVPYPQTESGQYDFLQGIKGVASSYKNVSGVFYWGAAWAQSNKWLVAPYWSDDDASRRSLFDDNGVATLGIRGLID